MWRFDRSRACLGTILFWIFEFLMSPSSGFICNALVLYHTTWLWLHFLVFGTDNGLHAVFFLLLVLRLFSRSFHLFFLPCSRGLWPKIWRSGFLLTTVSILFLPSYSPFLFNLSEQVTEYIVQRVRAFHDSLYTYFVIPLDSTRGWYITRY